MGLKRTFDVLELADSDCDGFVVCNQKYFTKEDTLEYLKEDMEDIYNEISDEGKEKLKIIETYWRYMRKDEIDDWEQEEDYKNGRSWFIQCNKNEKGAFKCWTII